MLIYYRTPDNYKFACYTFAIIQEMKSNPEAGQVSSNNILHFMEVGYYDTLKEKMLSLPDNEQIELNFEEFGTFCYLIDYTATCLISNVFYPRLKAIHEGNSFDNSVTFEEFTDFYLEFASRFMASMKKLYPDHPGVNQLFDYIASWNRSDKGF